MRCRSKGLERQPRQPRADLAHARQTVRKTVVDERSDARLDDEPNVDPERRPAEALERDQEARARSPADASELGDELARLRRIASDELAQRGCRRERDARR